MIILQCIVFDWILVNVFKVKVDHYFPLNADVTVYGAFTVTSDGRVGVNKEKKLERPLEITAHPGDASSVRVSQGETVTTGQFLEFGTTDNSGSFEESASISVGKLYTPLLALRHECYCCTPFMVYYKYFTLVLRVNYFLSSGSRLPAA